MSDNSYLREQLAATDALMHFLKTHDLFIDPDFHACRRALELGDTPIALKHAYNIKVFGMGSITDVYPTPIEPIETSQYAYVLLEALTRNWCFWISIADPTPFPPQKQPVDAIGKFLHHQKLRPTP